MKKTLFLILALAGALLGRAQDNRLSEEESQKIVQSDEYHTALLKKLEIAEWVYNAMRGGASAAELQKAFNVAVDKGDTRPLYQLVFGNGEKAKELLGELGAAQQKLRESYPQLFSEVPACLECETDVKEQFAYLLKHADGFHDLYATTVSTGKTIAPTCGSWWNQAQLLACGYSCNKFPPVISLYCGWGCWCKYCRKNSVLAEHICD
ncbi:MAG: hypothetical protein EOO08_01595 [Chitinophagaceae bacterium]|nr:MAG: hypothetical protein EOO08_01595 [Chitinophagaceae bacterium]